MGKLVHSNVYYHPMQLTNYLTADYYSFLQSDHQCLVQWVFVFVKSTHLSKERKGNEDRKEGEIKHELYTTWIIGEINQSPTILANHFFLHSLLFFNNIGIFKATTTTGIEIPWGRACDICLCFGWYGSQGLLLNLMPSYCV